MQRNCFFFVMMCAMLCACSIKGGHTQYRVTPIMSGSGLKLAQQKIYIAMPYNSGKDVETEKADAQTQQALQAALSRASGEKIYASRSQSLPEGHTSAKAAACDYFIWTEILDWYDPPASFQIASDRGEVTLSIYDAQTGRLLQSDNISCNGSATTVNRIGSYSPKDCLKPAFDEWVTKNI